MIPLDPTLLAAATSSAEAALNKALALDPGSRQRFIALGERCVAIVLQPLGLALYLRTDEGRLRISTVESSADVTLTGTPLSLARRVLTDNPSLSLHDNDIQVQGDATLAADFQRILRGLEIDWENALAEVVGEIPAHFMASRLRNALRWGKQAKTSLSMSVEEYIIEESGWLPHKEEATPHFDTIDELRLQTDRLEARIQRLHNQIVLGAPLSPDTPGEQAPARTTNDN